MIDTAPADAVQSLYIRHKRFTATDTGVSVELVWVRGIAWCHSCSPRVLLVFSGWHSADGVRLHVP